MRAAGVHAKTNSHAKRVDSSKFVVDRCIQSAERVAVSWSAGKDSTVMTHLVRVEMGCDVTAVSEKDDLDFPGEDAYVRDLAAAWGLRLRVVRPDISPSAWVAEHAGAMHVGDDIHARSAGLSKVCFYRVMESADRDFDAVMLGLRSEESQIRRYLRERRGRLYALRGRGGQLRCLPVADWSGIDVFAYAVSRGIELLPMYRCIGLMHATEPWRLRKSWWLPGSGAAHGQVAWLRRYYPSLFTQLVMWMPHARALT